MFKKLITKSTTTLCIASILALLTFIPASATTNYEEENSESYDLVLEFSEITAAQFNTNEILSSEDSLGVNDLIPKDEIPFLPGMGLIAPLSSSHNSPSTALSLEGYYIRNNVDFFPRGTWYSWKLYKEPLGNYAPNNMYTMYFNAPSNYELLLTNPSLTIIYQIPNNQALHLSYSDLVTLFGMSPNNTTSLDLYLTVQIISAPITQDYRLYYGPTHRNGSTDYIDTNLSINFGTLNVPPPQFWFSPVYQFNGMLTDTNVPDQSLITEMWLTSDGTGWGIVNGEKFIATASGFSTGIQIIDKVDIPKNVHPVKQEYAIQGKLRQSTNHVWKPKLRFTYTYPVISSNVKFLPVIDIR